MEAGKERTRKQEERVKALAAGGPATGLARATLEAFKNLEKTMMRPRDLIRQELKKSSSPVLRWHCSRNRPGGNIDPVKG